jgi:hypothetical protein
VSAPKGTVQVSKIAAAQRQLDAAIRMFFDREDELATHTVAAAAFQIFRDLTQKRGIHFTGELFKWGILNLAKQYAAGTMPPQQRALIEGSDFIKMIEPLIADIRKRGDKVDVGHIRVTLSKQREHKLWLSEITNFLKHADRDASNFLSTDRLDNEKILTASCSAYLELMKQPTPEIIAYFAFWSVKNYATEDLAKEVQPFARRLERANEAERFRLCAQYIREKKGAA